MRERRRGRGWRQIDLAAHAELSKTHICELKTGKREVGLLTLRRIAVALEVKMSDLFRGLVRLMDAESFAEDLRVWN
jgi:transcriptional regulator with XRE-family HTH domain